MVLVRIAEENLEGRVVEKAGQRIMKRLVGEFVPLLSLSVFVDLDGLLVFI